MNTCDFDFDLPPELIAQSPLPERTESRMMVLQRSDSSIRHFRITDLPGILVPGDLLVVNDTKVFPARIFGKRNDTGGRIEMLLVEEISPGEWDSYYRASSPPKPGVTFTLASGNLSGEVTSVDGEGRVKVKLAGSEPVMSVLQREGLPPLPPYIKRGHEKSRSTELDLERYQTVYARYPGAVAAPTAGLHFTEELFAALRNKGVNRTSITLHVGPGTFKPVKTETVEEHQMEAERYEINADAAEKINSARNAGHRIIAVGSTAVRTLETVASKYGSISKDAGRTSIFVHPPHSFKAVDGMLTNFHLPRSTLLMMVSAFAGRDFILKAYYEAISRKYRFYSYGDCMLIL